MRLVWHWLTVSPGILLISTAACVFVLLALSLAFVLLGGRGGQPSDSDPLAAGPTTGVEFAPAESAGDEELRKPPPQTPREAARVEAASPEKPLPTPAAKTVPPAPTAGIRPPPTDPVRSPAAKIPAPPSGPRKVSPRELTGISRRYDDMECSRIQQRHGRRVPPAAMILEVDGKRLAVAGVGNLQASPCPYLFLPRGEHIIRWREGERAIDVSIAEDLGATYADMRTFFAVAGNIRSDELFSRGARTMDVHRTPFLLNFTGAAYAARNEWQAAERRFRRALRVNPLFSPAHLNLAHCLAKRGQKDEALRELYLAQAFNVGDVFGLQPGIVQLGREVGVTPSQLEQPPAVDCRVDVYVASEPLREEDRRLSAILTAASKYAVREEDCGKILNNLAVHFADTGRPELALDHFRSALEAFKLAGPDRFELGRRVLSQMAATCRRAGYVEADEYTQMQNAVMP